MDSTGADSVLPFNKISDIVISSIECRCAQNDIMGRTNVTFNTNKNYSLLTIGSISNKSSFTLTIYGDGTSIYSISSARSVSLDISKYNSIRIYIQATEKATGATCLNNVCLKAV